MTLAWASDAMRKLEDEMYCASLTDASVMLSGESGVGKQFAAKMIHQLSPRRRDPFTAINALDIASGEDGAIYASDNGSLLLQDIEQIPASTQRQLMGFLDRTATRRHVRVMTATTTELFRLVQDGAFRDDLFYRLNVIHLTIPPLRERPEDIPLMFNHYLSLDARTRAPKLSSAARRRLVEYSWPGNVRELRRVTKHLSAIGVPDLIEPEHLPEPIGD
jgi:two-component system, NtrC family, response regulator